MTFSPQKPMQRGALLAAGAFGLMLAASSARAQDYGRFDEPAYQNGLNEEVEVIAPPYREERTPLNAPPGRVSLSHVVRYDDLDLRTREGAHELRARIRETARDICEQLDAEGPIPLAGSPPCYRTAVEPALNRAETAISEARYDPED